MLNNFRTKSKGYNIFKLVWSGVFLILFTLIGTFDFWGTLFGCQHPYIAVFGFFFDLLMVTITAIDMHKALNSLVEG